MYDNTLRSKTLDINNMKNFMKHISYIFLVCLTAYVDFTSQVLSGQEGVDIIALTVVLSQTLHVDINVGKIRLYLGCRFYQVHRDYLYKL